jgi:hypothetical protein
MVAKFKQDGISTEIHNAAAPIVAVPRSLDSVSLPSYYLRNEVKCKATKYHNTSTGLWSRAERS